MPKSKESFYAVCKGNTPGIYKTWAECQKQISGFHRPIFYKFKTYEEAEKFMEEGAKCVKTIDEVEDNSLPFVYVDGSNSKSGNNKFPMVYGYGVILSNGMTFKGNIIENIVKNPGRKSRYIEKAKMYNVAGEIDAAARATHEMYMLGITEFNMFYDYEGIPLFVTGAFKPEKNDVYITEYINYMHKMMEKVKIHFYSCDSHTGIEFNEKVDKLAKEAVSDGLKLIDEIGIDKII